MNSKDDRIAFWPYNKSREFFEGRKKYIAAHVLFTDAIKDIFYIIRAGDVIDDYVERTQMNSEFAKEIFLNDYQKNTYRIE